MRLLLGKILLLIIIVFLICQLGRMTVPEFWCGQVIANKEKVFFDNENYNTVFLGTSRINHGFSPKTFDKAIKEYTKKPISTFNFGISGASSGEIYHLIQEILNRKPPKLKYVVVELCSIGTALGEKFCERNLHTKRNIYWQDWNALQYSLNNTAGYIYPPKMTQKKWTHYKNYGVNYIENQWSMGMMSSYLTYFLTPYPQHKGLGNALDGYNNIELIPDPGVDNARTGFLKNKEQLSIKERNSQLFFGETYEPDQYNEIYLQQLKELIKEAEAADLRLIFLVPPLMSISSYKELSPIFRNLPPKNKMNLTNSKKYPELYELKHTWDGNHLDHSGATIFSKLLAKEFTQKISKKK